MITKEKELPVLRIGKHQPKYPIVQGGMGVMISGPRLAGTVAAEGGIGTLASVGLGVLTEGYNAKNFAERNSMMLKNSSNRQRISRKAVFLRSTACVPYATMSRS